MKAIGYQTAGAITAPNALENITLAEPTATGFDLLVEIKAISVNPVDTKIRASSSASAGEYKIIGWDAVGVVKAVGEKASLFNVAMKCGMRAISVAAEVTQNINWLMSELSAINLKV